jgi:hypothetical protein
VGVNAAASAARGGSRQTEAERQRALLGAILAPRAEAASLALSETGERAERGLAAYRANAEVHAERALGAAFGSIRAMVGDEDFSHLAAEFWRASPPQCGDVGEWGAGFADWLQVHPAMANWPYLADCARLDFAMHLNERAIDASLDADSLALLGDADPRRVRLELMPGTALVSSPWPIVTIHRAHRSGADVDFALAREAIEGERAQHALVSRDGWRAAVTELAGPEAAWTSSLLDGANLAKALDHTGAGFDFAGWLARAIQRRWLKAIVRVDD